MLAFRISSPISVLDMFAPGVPAEVFFALARFWARSARLFFAVFGDTGVYDFFFFLDPVGVAEDWNGRILSDDFHGITKESGRKSSLLTKAPTPDSTSAGTAQGFRIKPLRLVIEGRSGRNGITDPCN